MTVTLDEPQINSQPKQETPKTKGKGNPLMKSLYPSMLASPHPLAFADGMPSYEFCLEKILKLIIEPLQFETREAWLAFASSAWQWREQSKTRKAQKEAEAALERMALDAEGKKLLLEKLKAEVEG